MSFTKSRSVGLSLTISLAMSVSFLGCAASSTPTPCEPSAAVDSAPKSPEADEAASAKKSEQKLPSLSLWRDGATRKAIVQFVEKVVDPLSPDFVPEAQRIVTIDNDGTLWSEQPMYAQLAFTMHRVKELSAEHPEWKKKQPFQAVLEGDMKALAAAGEEGLLKLLIATHTGMSTDEFEKLASDWLKQAKHPKYDKLYTELTFAPMVELLDYLRAHKFKTFIVSGGGISFMRPFTQAVYGIPPEQVIGSRMKTKFEEKEGEYSVQRLPEIDFIDDGPGKPVGIYQMIGSRPLMAIGNSDGDMQMLQWTSAGQGPRMALLVHHTDAERETAYDRESAMGKLDKALDIANSEPGQKAGWQVIDIKKDWKKVFAFQEVAETLSPAAEAAVDQPVQD